MSPGRTSDDWWAVTDSNRRHPACKADALPTELTAPPEVYRQRPWPRKGVSRWRVEFTLLVAVIKFAGTKNILLAFSRQSGKLTRG